MQPNVQHPILATSIESPVCGKRKQDELLDDVSIILYSYGVLQRVGCTRFLRRQAALAGSKVRGT